MLVTPEDLYTELYPEIVDEITRFSDNEVITQIQAAEDFVKGFLFKYDLNALFGHDDVYPTVEDEGLKKCVKIIASYFLVRKANPNVNIELFEHDFNLMIGTSQQPGWLTEIRKGNINPDWPYREDNPNTPEDESQDYAQVYWNSNIKRTNSF